MPEQVPFIGREAELERTDELIREWGTLRFLFIDGPGGIGKTRLLQEVRKRCLKNASDRLIVTKIIDFDDRMLHVPATVGNHIGQMLDKAVFEPYFKASLDHRKMEIAGVSPEKLREQFLKNDEIFIDCFNKVSKKKRVLIFLDTTEALQGTDFWDYLIKMGTHLKNVLILIAGRNAQEIGESLKNNLTEKEVGIKKLPPLVEEGKEYLEKKQAILRINLDSELTEKLILLAGGRPILIDLATEWLAREIPFNWLTKSSLEDIESELEERQKEFERQLVIHIAQLRSEIDRLIFLMSHVYPLDENGIAELLQIKGDRSKEIFDEAKTYVFVKSLPDGRITLHDEMRRMLKEHVWSEADPEKDKLRLYSNLAIVYLNGMIDSLNNDLEIEEKSSKKEKDSQEELDSFTRRIKINESICLLQVELVKHKLFVNIDKGFKLFVELFDESGRISRYMFKEMSLVLMQEEEYVHLLSVEQQSALNSRRIEYLNDRGDYSKAEKLASELSEKQGDISLEIQIDMLIKDGNTEIRMGRVNKGISKFEKAVKLSEGNPLLSIEAKNALGWAYRLTGDLDTAKKYYVEAQQLCLNEENWQNVPKLAKSYGWILNNLTFILSTDNKDRRAAINVAKSAVEYWPPLKDDAGLGAAYLVLGIAYYRNDIMKDGLDAFEKALRIFEPLGYKDWLGQIYSWRGALYQDEKEYDKAEKDLNKSLKIGPSSIKAMTLNRLARVYMSQKRWDEAEKRMNESLKEARKIPDRVYELGSIGRLASIASEKSQFERFDEFKQEIENYFKKVENWDENSKGIAYLGLSKLGLGQRDRSKESLIIEYLKEGIDLVTKHGSYARTDIVTRLKDVEKCFPMADTQTIRNIGTSLKEYFAEKMTEDMDFIVVTQIMDKWSKWE